MDEQRYSRHRAFFSDEAWQRMLATPVVIAGVGGLGGHVAGLLARIAPLTLEIWDPAVVDEPDLNRQVLYTTEDLGRRKVAVAAQALLRINPGLRITTHAEALTATSFVAPEPPVPGATGVSFVLFDCLDNYPARRELQTVHRGHGAPLFHGGAEGWYGQAGTLIDAGAGYDSMLGPGWEDYPKATKPILPQVPQVVAATQVGEYLRYSIDGPPTPLSGRLWLYDGRRFETRIVEGHNR